MIAAGISPGTKIGSCTVLEPIARGGMAEVYRGVQEPLQRRVAIKVLQDSLHEENAAERFRREAVALARLHHEHICAIHELIEQGDRLHMVLELIEGVSVADLLDHAPVPLDVALLIASRVASALEHAHFRKIIHRDVKPSNVMISFDGEVKLTDFGIARDPTFDPLTGSGCIVGTPSYLSPEQIRSAGKNVDHRTDIYALGVLLYELLTAKRPYVGKDEHALFVAILAGKRPRLSALAKDTPEAVEAIVDRCLAVDPDDRYQRAAEVRQDLERAMEGLVPGAASARMVAYLMKRGHVRRDELSELEIEVLEVEDAEDADPELPARSESTDLLPPDTGVTKLRWERRRQKALGAVVMLIALAGAGALIRALGLAP